MLRLFFFAPLAWLVLMASQLMAGPSVLVSVAPHAFFVKKIANGTVEVNLMVPAGASSHTFEPTPKQMIAASHADLWFTIGESFEEKAAKALSAYKPDLKIIDLRQGLDLIEERHCHCSGHAQQSCIDPHFWLSPIQAKIQAATIAKALTERYPENDEIYRKGLEAFLKELDQLNTEIEAKLRPLKNRTIMVSHPAYAYFCRDYRLKQLSIEFEGKDPTPQLLTRTLQAARETGTKKIFIQLQYNNKGARLIAKELGAEVIVLDPYSEDYLNSMKEIALQFSLNDG